MKLPYAPRPLGSSRQLRFHQALLILLLAGMASLGWAAETSPKPLFPGLTPVCSCESLANTSILNTTINSAAPDPSNGWCRVTATVTHPPLS